MTYIHQPTRTARTQRNSVAKAERTLIDELAGRVEEGDRAAQAMLFELLTARHATILAKTVRRYED